MSDVALPTTTEVAKPAIADITHLASLERQERELRAAVAEFTGQLKLVQAKIQEAGGEAEELLVNGRPVFSHAYIDKVRGKDLEKDFPIIFEACSHDVVKHELDENLLKVAHPELYRRYQSRQFRRIG